jgi:hypothetical protein
MRSEVMDAHDPNNSSSAARIRDYNSTPPNYGGKSSEATRFSRSMSGRVASNVSPPTHRNQEDRCASYTAPHPTSRGSIYRDAFEDVGEAWN